MDPQGQILPFYPGFVEGDEFTRVYNGEPVFDPESMRFFNEDVRALAVFFVPFKHGFILPLLQTLHNYQGEPLFSVNTPEVFDPNDELPPIEGVQVVGSIEAGVVCLCIVSEVVSLMFRVDLQRRVWSHRNTIGDMSDAARLLKALTDWRPVPCESQAVVAVDTLVDMPL
ncbi:MAG TPA: hypothetical protein VNG90_03370 [Candidatus Acidoferrum sp.]|nr:hypothetical protein [Candidatus Acidoferrum sp.]